MQIAWWLLYPWSKSMNIWRIIILNKHPVFAFCFTRGNHGEYHKGIWFMQGTSWSISATLTYTYKYTILTSIISINILYHKYHIIWVNYNNSLTWIEAIWGWFRLLTMISSGRSEVVIIYPDISIIYQYHVFYLWFIYNKFSISPSRWNNTPIFLHSYH